MYTRTTTVIERSDVASILFYRWKEGHMQSPLRTANLSTLSLVNIQAVRM